MIILISIVVVCAALLIGLAVPTEIFETVGALIVAIVCVAAILTISFFITAGIFWLICWAFAFTFSWKIAFGVWLVVLILRSIFKSSITIKKN